MTQLHLYRALRTRRKPTPAGYFWPMYFVVLFLVLWGAL